MVSCEHYDFIEIACLYRHKVKLILKSGSEVFGVAIDTALNADREECIKIENDDRNWLITLNSIATMQALNDNQQFSIVTFS